ncbi:hypothetical protein RDI58_019558 [Solanum bulbocastanum]|uniref:Calcineurin B-like protein n=1 Tax=Solanum bulbocastanum TaxID=147425 RepID=A0AAN8TB44_SOLBU
MGCALRKQERIYEDQALLAAQTHFSLEDVKSLTELFKKFSCSICIDCNDGFISREEFQLGLFRDNRKHSLFSDRVKELMFGLLYESELILTDDIVEGIINKTIEDADSKGDGKIDIEEWNSFA